MGRVSGILHGNHDSTPALVQKVRQRPPRWLGLEPLPAEERPKKRGLFSLEKRQHRRDHRADPSTAEEVIEKTETGYSQQCVAEEQEFLSGYEESIFQSQAN